MCCSPQTVSPQLSFQSPVFATVSQWQDCLIPECPARYAFIITVAVGQTVGKWPRTLWAGCQCNAPYIAPSIYKTVSHWSHTPVVVFYGQTLCSPTARRGLLMRLLCFSGMFSHWWCYYPAPQEKWTMMHRRLIKISTDIFETCKLIVCTTVAGRPDAKWTTKK